MVVSVIVGSATVSIRHDADRYTGSSIYSSSAHTVARNSYDDHFFHILPHRKASFPLTGNVLSRSVSYWADFSAWIEFMYLPD